MTPTAPSEDPLRNADDADAPARASAELNGLTALSALLAVTLVMRGPVTMVGPLGPELSALLSLTPADFGVLTALPIALFGLGSFAAAPLAGRFGLRQGAALAVLLVLLGTFARVVPSWWPLLAATGVAALGIAILNVLIPVVIKTAFSGSVGRVMGIYTGVVGLSGALGGLTAVPLADALGVAAPTCAWGVVAAAALVFWRCRAPHARGAEAGSSAKSAKAESGTFARLLRSPTAVALIGVMGVQSLLIYTVAAWLPGWLQNLGTSAEMSGTWLFIYLVSGLPASVLTPRFMRWCGSERTAEYVLAGLYLFGVAGWTAGGAWLLPASIAAGASQGAMLSVAFLLMAEKTSGTREMLAMSALAQGVGYLFAGTGPWIFGLLLETGGAAGWISGWIFTAVMIVLWAAAGWMAARRSRI